MKQAQAKHKLCRRLGYCIWNMPKCPSVKRPYAAGLQGKNRKKSKLSTYGVMMQEKQKLKAAHRNETRRHRLSFRYRSDDLRCQAVCRSQTHPR